MPQKRRKSSRLRRLEREHAAVLNAFVRALKLAVKQLDPEQARWSDVAGGIRLLNTHVRQLDTLEAKQAAATDAATRQTPAAGQASDAGAFAGLKIHRA